MKFNYEYLLTLLIKSLILGVIVFVAVTRIPDNVPKLRNRIIISIVVAVLFSLIDYVQKLLVDIRNLTCKLACGCSPGAVTDINLDELTKPETPTIPPISTTTGTATPTQSGETCT